MVCGDVDWIRLAQDRVSWKVFCKQYVTYLLVLCLFHLRNLQLVMNILRHGWS
jgi:hypothetical protein